MTAAFPYKFVIDIVAASKDMTTTDRIEQELGVTLTSPETTLMEALIHEASALMVGYGNRDFAEEKRTDHYRTDCAPEQLFVSLWPITTVHAIVEDGETLTSTDWEMDSKAGCIWRLDGDDNRTLWLGGVKITVQHTSGYEMLPDLPHDLERACLWQTLAMYHARKRDQTLRSFEIPDVFQAQFAVPGGDNFGASGLMLSVEGAIAPYRKYTVG